MDRVIEKKRRSPVQWTLLGVGALAAVLVLWQLSTRVASSRLRVDTTRLTVGAVQQGEFREYYPFDGTVEPADTVYLDIEQGGRVDQIFVEGGQLVKKGQLILRFSNAEAQRQSIETETRLLETLDTQRNTEFNRAQSNIQLQETLLELNHQIQDAQTKFDRYDNLMKTPNSPISRLDFDNLSHLLQYLKNRRVLLKERIKQEDLLSENQIAQAKKSIKRLNENLDLLNRIVQALDVRAPISGELSTVDAQIGQNINRGQRIGQIDVPGTFKIRAKIDQFYISRVQVGTPGHVNLDGRDWDVKVKKIYPEVKQNTFEADVVFDGETPTTIKRGQSVNVELIFGSPTETLFVPKGGFYQETGGRWVYLISPDGKTARRVDVKLGRQNPRQVEVLEGLKKGDRIITSGYDTFNEADQLKFSEAIPTQQDEP